MTGTLSSYTECSILDDNCKNVTLIDCMVNKKICKMLVITTTIVS